MTKTTIILDSSKRPAQYASNNKWAYDLKTVYQNIKEIKLIGAIIANSQYVINVNNKVITVNRSGTDYTFTLTESSYTPTSLATELQTQLNTNGFGGVFTVSANSATNKIRLQCTVAVIYKFALNASLGRILGFGNANTSATTDITSINCYQVTSTRYYKVLIKEISNDVDSNIQPLFFTFLIPNNVNSGEYNYLTNQNNINNVIHQVQQQNIAKLSIEIYDEDSQLIQLNGIDYLLMLEFEK
jgi:hypothetical protein